MPFLAIVIEVEIPDGSANSPGRRYFEAGAEVVIDVAVDEGLIGDDESSTSESTM